MSGVGGVGEVLLETMKLIGPHNLGKEISFLFCEPGGYQARQELNAF